MPWEETDAMQERGKFVLEYDSGLWSMTRLCERYGITRTTGYKWWNRFVEGGFSDLEDRSRAPVSCPHRTAKAVAAAIVALRRDHPHWGPVTLRYRLERIRPELELPATSTIGAILQRHGLVKSRPRRRRPRHPGKPYLVMEAPNDVWSADFKGEFKMRDSRYCFPLTVADGSSRYLLGCRGRHSTSYEGARPVFETLFREYGLPQQILTDNGCPFSNSTALGGLSLLSVWWIRLGIHPVRIEPGCPAQNGRHERMHRTLKAEATRPPAGNLSAQQRAFNRFRCCFNTERPHHALEGKTPADLYVTSSRPYPSRLPVIEYPGHYEVRKVRCKGDMKWKGSRIFVSTVLRGESLGLEETDSGTWSVWFGPVELGRLDERDRRLWG